MTEKELREYFLDTAEKYIGYSEASGKHKQILAVYNNHKPLARNYKVQPDDEWCATYVSAMSILAGLTDIIPTECSCQKQIELFKKLDSFVEADNYVPTRGDIIFYDWGDNGRGDDTGWADHVGIVSEVKNSQIVVLEGNRKESVGYRTIGINGKTIRGFAVPKYALKADKVVANTEPIKTKEECTVNLNVLRKGDEGKEVKALQILLIGYGYKCGSAGADGDFGSGTLAAVKKYQKAKGLTADGIVGAKTWASLLK